MAAPPAGAVSDRRVLIEACVDSVESALEAERGGAARVELCADLVEGGTTPSRGMIELCCERLRIPVHVIVRPRGGDFVYSEAELEVMRRDVRHAAHAGAAAVVVGVLQPDGTIDVERTQRLVQAAEPLGVTFHRAFDLTRDADEALEAVLRTGADRLLTSGRAATAEAGIGTIARLVERAPGSFAIVAGGGVRAHNVERIVAATGVREIHARAATSHPSPMRYVHAAVRFGGGRAPADDVRLVTAAGTVAAIRERANRAAAPPVCD